MSNAPDKVIIPDHSREEKARENPLFAVMTTAYYAASDRTEFTQDELDSFFAKSQRVYQQIVKPRAALCQTGATDPLFVEYGCGMGRILKATIEDGHRAAGMDISPTMIQHCPRLVPQVAENVHVLSPENRSPLPDACADVVFSFAVMKHIHTMTLYSAALDEMIRLMKPGSVLVLNVNSNDFISGSFDRSERTVNFEGRSKHYRAGEEEPYKPRIYSTWSGIYIGFDYLASYLSHAVLVLLETFHHTLKKPQGIWVIARRERI